MIKFCNGWMTARGGGPHAGPTSLSFSVAPLGDGYRNSRLRKRHSGFIRGRENDRSALHSERKHDMCRWIAYKGRTIPLERYVTEPQHSLVRQSIGAKEALGSTQGDGFGLGWYAA